MKPLIAITGVVVEQQKKGLILPKDRTKASPKIKAIPVSEAEKSQFRKDDIHAAIIDVMAESFVQTRQDDFRKFHLAHLGFGIKQN